LLVLKGDGKSPNTIEKYRESLSQLMQFLARDNYPLLTSVTAEHLREWLKRPQRARQQARHREHALPVGKRLFQLAGNRR
jgi:site-specific recombinase XerD